MKSVAILGATGSIGSSTLDLIERNPRRYRVSSVTAASNVESLADIARRTKAGLAVIADEARLEELERLLEGSGCRAATGEEALVEAAVGASDLVVAAIVGCAGLKPVMAAVEAGKVIALANKEALVTAGPFMTDAAIRSGATILPTDSEHNAIFQCLGGSRLQDVSRLTLTASGGPFRILSAEAMKWVTPTQAVDHPNWSMGAKISVDSATMMNKGLELIEASYLFGLPSAQIEIVVHPQSVVHSLVEFVDGSVLAQLGAPDMRIPIAYALAWPERMATPADRLSLAALARLDFAEPDSERFPALRLARSALEAGKAAPVILNAANEVAVDAFLGNQIGFTDIVAIVEELLDQVQMPEPTSIDEVVAIDAEVRPIAARIIEERRK